MTWEILDHTADIGLRVYGKDISSAFSEIGEAMFKIMVDGDVDAVEHRVLRMEDENLDQLLVDYLSQLLFIFETEGFMAGRCSAILYKNPGGWRLVVDVKGERYDPSKHEINFEIKAVTYHMLEVAEDGFIQVLFDI